MDFLLDPNLAYLFLLVGLLLGLMALVTPGTGVFEVGALFSLALAGYAVYNLLFNLWALIVLVLSIIPFVYAIQKPNRERYLALSILGLVVGSVYLFASDKWWQPSVNPILALISSILYAGLLWIVIKKTLQASHSRPSHDLSVLIGQIGEAKTRIYKEGTVQVEGELWSAHSQNSIPPGSLIKVVAREGFVLVVEKSSDSK
ncbi:MAG: NfeD family protein [Anaerolineae bacterium]|nr:NfeD family protein [Anaerolineae bacterium]MDK1081354.1 NfeD family protein [Anaerolineae bacterium]MDK1118268.1 NfeD family protein [Anaerolineae bacterium]